MEAPSNGSNGLLIFMTSNGWCIGFCRESRVEGNMSRVRGKNVEGGG